MKSNIQLRLIGHVKIPQVETRGVMAINKKQNRAPRKHARVSSSVKSLCI